MIQEEKEYPHDVFIRLDLPQGNLFTLKFKSIIFYPTD